jgi:NAD(P)-dependent dehydrogenase (short-subunit alcohol dehydrogenase family)
MRVKDRIAIVTGGGSGIGRGTCLRLSEEGASIAVFDVNLESAEDTVREIDRSGGKGLALKVNVSAADEVEAAVQKVVQAFGRIDILVNNAGMSDAGSISRMTDELWDKMHDVNLKGVFLCCRAVIPHMKKQRYGRIVNIASILAKAGSAGMAHYCSTKAGVVGFTQGLAMEVGPRNITVNAVGPGIIDTPMLDQETRPDLRERLVQGVPLRRLGEPRDIANAILFLVSDESSYITGQCLYVCGGWSASAGLA